MNERTLVFAVSPGGEKHEILTSLLLRDGYEAFIADEDDITDAHIYITPAARQPQALMARGITPVEYLKRQDFKECNGILTAEAAVAEAQKLTDFAIAGSRVLVIGSGCIALPLANMLRAMGAFVTVAARNTAARCKARLMGFGAFDMCFMGGEYDVVFNTVPAPVLDRAALMSLNRDTVIIDLASLPGGVDKAAAEELGIRVCPALALPGRYMPETAAKIIRACVRSAIREMVL